MINLSTIGIATALCYIALGAFYATLLNKNQSLQWGHRSLTLCALMAHAYCLHILIDTTSGQNLSLVNLISQVFWSLTFILVLIEWFKPIRPLVSVACCLASITLLVSIYFPGEHYLVLGDNPFALVHILMAILTLSILLIAALQGLFMLIQDALLKRHHFDSVSLPSLEAMEKLMSKMVLVGYGLLTLVLVSGFVPIWGLETKMTKVALTIGAWLVFSLFLSGRYYYGWRGIITVRYTFTGVSLLLALMTFSFMP